MKWPVSIGWHMFAERAEIRQHSNLFADSPPFFIQIAGNSLAKPRIGDPVQRMGFDRQIATGDLVFTLRPRLDAGKPLGNGEIYGLIIAEFKMQAGMVFNRPPVTPEKRTAPDKIQGPRDRVSIAFCQNKQDIIAQCCLSDIKEFACQVRMPPFAPAGVLLKVPERFPMFGVDS